MVARISTAGHHGDCHAVTNVALRPAPPREAGAWTPTLIDADQVGGVDERQAILSALQGGQSRRDPRQQSVEAGDVAAATAGRTIRPVEAGRSRRAAAIVCATTAAPAGV